MPDAAELESLLVRQVLAPWFPRCLDREYGGYLCDFDRRWQPCGPHDKRLEFQARQTWLAALASRRYPGDEGLREAVRHGLRYLREPMWDAEHGGWFYLLDRAGLPRDGGRKHAHGAAYAIAACAEASVTLGDEGALELARTAYDWLRSHVYDRRHGGYFGFQARDGSVIRDPGSYPRPADPISTPIGLKDANVNSDLVEALNVLVAIDPRRDLGERLAELCEVIVRRMVGPDGMLAFYCHPDWRPVAGARIGTQLQTAHRLVTAGRLLGGGGTFDQVAARLFRLANERGWDRRSGGFVFANFGYRPQRREWWPHFECLRALATLGPLAGGDGERRTIESRVWDYVRRRLLDARYGGLYKEGLDGVALRRRAFGTRFAPVSAVAKGDIWKDGWHEGKAWLVCMAAREGERVLA